VASNRLSRRTLLQAGGLGGIPLAAAPARRSSAQEARGRGRKGRGLRYKGLFMHAWDLRDDGIDRVLGWMRDSGLDTLCMAGTYHSGWFVHPHNSRHRAFMTEGSVCYFHPREALYRGTRLRPVVSQVSAEIDWFAEASRRLDRFGLRMVSWTVGAHNTRLGLAHSEHTQRNVYGDSLPHALCPADDDVRAYLSAICRDLATQYAMWGLQLESFGWGALAHGHHHQRDLTSLSPLEQELMALCFCPSCTRKAGAAGVDVARARTLVKGVLDAVFREAPDRPAGHPRSMAELESRSPDLARLNAWRKTVVVSLIRAIKTEALGGTSCRLLLQEGYDPDLAGAADGFACWAYGKSPAESLEVCRAARAACPAAWDGELQCYVRLGMGVPARAAELRAIVEAVRDGGCNGLNFYNRSEAPPKMLGWVKGALRGV
jgi:hypothetical protein